MPRSTHSVTWPPLTPQLVPRLWIRHRCQATTLTQTLGEAKREPAGQGTSNEEPPSESEYPSEPPHHPASPVKEDVATDLRLIQAPEEEEKRKKKRRAYYRDPRPAHDPTLAYQGDWPRPRKLVQQGRSVEELHRRKFIDGLRTTAAWTTEAACNPFTTINRPTTVRSLKLRPSRPMTKLLRQKAAPSQRHRLHQKFPIVPRRSKRSLPYPATRRHLPCFPRRQSIPLSFQSDLHCLVLPYVPPRFLLIHLPRAHRSSYIPPSIFARSLSIVARAAAALWAVLERTCRGRRPQSSRLRRPIYLLHGPRRLPMRLKEPTAATRYAADERETGAKFADRSRPRRPRLHLLLDIGEPLPFPSHLLAPRDPSFDLSSRQSVHRAALSLASFRLSDICVGKTSSALRPAFVANTAQSMRRTEPVSSSFLRRDAENRFLRVAWPGDGWP